MKRSVLKYYGAKFAIAPWIIQHFPSHKFYVEPFAGSAAVLLQKQRTKFEIYNDLDGEIVNYYQVLRDKGPELAEKLSLTPWARDEYNGAFECDTEDSVERARKTAIKAWFCFGSDGVFSRNGFRGRIFKRTQHTAQEWSTLPGYILQATERLRGVVIENVDALECIKKYDSADTLFYVDPPYVLSARKSSSHRYRHEFEEHTKLLKLLKKVKGKVVLSGYMSELYKQELKDWQCFTKSTPAMRGVGLEHLWLSPTAQEGSLFYDTATA